MEKKLKEPSWEREPLDADRPFLEQLEEKTLNAPNEEQFARELGWLQRNYYRDRNKVPAITNRPTLTHLKVLP